MQVEADLGRWTSRPVARLVSAFLAGTISGCAVPEQFVPVDSQSSAVGLVSVGIDRANGHGVYALNGSRLYLTNYEPQDRSFFRPSRIVKVIEQPTEVVALVEGRTATCPLRYQLISFFLNEAKGNGFYFGRCGQRFMFVEESTRIAIIEDGPADPEIMYYAQHILGAPFHQVAIEQPPPAPPPPPPPPAPPPSAPATADTGVPWWIKLAAVATAEYLATSTADDTHDCVQKAFWHGVVNTVNQGIFDDAVEGYFTSDQHDPAARKDVENMLSFFEVALAENSSREFVVQLVERKYPDNKFLIAAANNIAEYYASCEADKPGSGDTN